MVGAISLPTISLITAMILWASSFVALKYVINEFNPMQVVFGRMFVASLCFLVIFKKLKIKEYRKGDWKYLLGMAACEPCLYFILEVQALRYTTASEAGMITALLPLMTAILAWLTLKEKICKKTVTGFLIAIVGVLWLSLSGKATESAPNPLLGNFLEFSSMVCATFYSVMLKKLSDRYSALFLTAMQAFIGTIFFLPLAAYHPIPTEFDYMPLLAIVYLGSFVTLLAYLLYNWSISKVNLTTAVSYVNLIPVFTILLAYVLLGETLTGQQMLASILVLVGVMYSQRKSG